MRFFVCRQSFLEGSVFNDFMPHSNANGKDVAGFLDGN